MICGYFFGKGGRDPIIKIEESPRPRSRWRLAKAPAHHENLKPGAGFGRIYYDVVRTNG
jgi:hypothetical protein